MLDSGLVVYTLISGIVIALLLIVCNKFVKVQRIKDKILKTSAILTVIIHYSTLYVDFFSTGIAELDNTMLLPVYPCNVVMWLLLIVSFMKNRRVKVFETLAVSTFYIGIVGGAIGVLFNEIYLSDPTFSDWDVLNGLLSHSTMTFGCIYLLVGGYINIRVKNVMSVACGLFLLLADGIAVISLYKLFNMDPPNCMYLLENPFPQIKWFNPLVLGGIGICVVFVITVLYEQFALVEENRWYVKIKESKEKNV
jgi:hypothetical protein